MAVRSYTLHDLLAAASAAEGTPIADRTVQQYLEAGIVLPFPGGKTGVFTEEQLLRLRLAVRLTAQYIPLREIRLFADRLSPRGLQLLVDRPTAARLPSEGDTRAYLERLLRSLGPGTLRPVDAAISPAPARPDGANVDQGSPETAAQPAGGTTWLHVEVAPDVTLQVRLQPGGHHHPVDQLVAALRAVLEAEARPGRGIASGGPRRQG